MKKGIVKANMIYLKRGGYIHQGQPISENDVDNFDKLVQTGKIEMPKGWKSAADKAAADKAAADKAAADKAAADKAAAANTVKK